MSRLNATKNYAKDKTICFPKYLAPFSIVFKVIEVFSGAKIRQIVVLEVASSFARRFTEINSNLYLYCTKNGTIFQVECNMFLYLFFV